MIIYAFIIYINFRTLSLINKILFIIQVV